jgi:predicted nucleic acid-binding protein
MKYVLDSSVAVKWVLPEVDSDKALHLRDDVRNGVHEVLAPDIFPAELAHALTKAGRQKRIDRTKARALWRSIMLDSPALHSSVPRAERAIDIATQFNIAVYDCLYISLAEQEVCEWVTADDKIVRNLQADFPFIVPLASLPA